MEHSRDVNVIFMGPLRRPPGMARQGVVSLAIADTLEQILARFGFQGEEQRQLQLLVDGKQAALGDRLGEAKELVVFLPLGGG